jgi:hypothetical protein
MAKIPKYVLEDLQHTVADRYERLCRYLGWEPREQWVRDLVEDLMAGRIGYDDILSMLGDADAYELYPKGRTAHRYLFALAVLLELMDRCPASRDIPDWLCDERLAAALGWFLAEGTVVPLSEAINKVLDEVLPDDGSAPEPE